MLNERFAGLKFPDMSRPETLQKKYVGKLSRRALSIMKALLSMEPRDRPTAEQCLQHNYFENMDKTRFESPPTDSQPTLPPADAKGTAPLASQRSGGFKDGKDSANDSINPSSTSTTNNNSAAYGPPSVAESKELNSGHQYHQPVPPQQQKQYASDSKAVTGMYDGLESAQEKVTNGVVAPNAGYKDSFPPGMLVFARDNKMPTKLIHTASQLQKALQAVDNAAAAAAVSSSNNAFSSNSLPPTRSSCNSSNSTNSRPCHRLTMRRPCNRHSRGRRT